MYVRSVTHTHTHIRLWFPLSLHRSIAIRGSKHSFHAAQPRPQLYHWSWLISYWAALAFFYLLLFSLTDCNIIGMHCFITTSVWAHQDTNTFCPLMTNVMQNTALLKKKTKPKIQTSIKLSLLMTCFPHLHQICNISASCVWVLRSNPS